MKELPIKFKKYREEFTQLGYNPQTEVYMYKREDKLGIVFYEVFKRKINAHGAVSYPKDAGFGKWAKCCRRKEDAERYYNNGF